MQIFTLLGIVGAIIMFSPILMLLAAIFGYVGGWLFGVFFDDTWIAIHTWLQMPAALTPGMLGAFMAAFGSFIGRHTTTKKD